MKPSTRRRILAAAVLCAWAPATLAAAAPPAFDFGSEMLVNEPPEQLWGRLARLALRDKLVPAAERARFVETISLESSDRDLGFLQLAIETRSRARYTIALHLAPAGMRYPRDLEAALAIQSGQAPPPKTVQTSVRLLVTGPMKAMVKEYLGEMARWLNAPTQSRW